MSNNHFTLQEFAGFTDSFYLCPANIYKCTRVNAILSIRPTFCKLIFDGQKLYEYRKKVFNRLNVDKVYVYASKPISKIVGYFTIKRIIEDRPSMVWELTHEHGGISKKQFNDYFKGCKMAHAIEIDEVVELGTPIVPKEVIKNFTAPQNFMYLVNDL